MICYITFLNVGIAQWQQVNSGLLDNVSVLSIGIKGNYIFAGTLDQGMFLSTNSGNTWILTDLTRDFWVNSIEISGNDIFAATTGGVFLSTNNGSTWVARNNGLSLEGLFVKAIAISA